MNESNWFRLKKVSTLLEAAGPRATPRKLRFFAAAYIGRMADRLFGEAQTNLKALSALFCKNKGSIAVDSLVGMTGVQGYFLSGLVKRTSQIAGPMIEFAFSLIEGQAVALKGETPGRYRKMKCDLLREVVPPPDLAPLPPHLLEWNGGIIKQLARAAADKEEWETLPILADALEEAGCTNAQLLAHCRQGGNHLPGCWAADWILGRK
jgi:hypothetical protein